MIKILADADGDNAVEIDQPVFSPAHSKIAMTSDMFPGIAGKKISASSTEICNADLWTEARGRLAHTYRCWGIASSNTMSDFTSNVDTNQTGSLVLVIDPLNPFIWSAPSWQDVVPGLIEEYSGVGAAPALVGDLWRVPRKLMSYQSISTVILECSPDAAWMRRSGRRCWSG